MGGVSPSQKALMDAAGVNGVRADASTSTKWTSSYGCGLNVLGILDQHTMPATWTLADWKVKVKQYVDTYPNCKNWEIWNETLLNKFRSGYLLDGATEANLPQRYTDVLREAYTIIKAKDPNNVVVGFGGLQMGLWGWDNKDSSALITDKNLLTQSKALGALNYCDAVSIHIYPGTGNPVTQAVYDHIATHLSELKALIGSKPLWVTEWGIQGAYASRTPPCTQTDWIKNLTPLLKTNGIKHFYWYGIQDDPYEMPSNPMGLLDGSGQPKPSYSAYSKYVVEAVYLSTVIKNEGSASVQVVKRTVVVTDTPVATLASGQQATVTLGANDQIVLK